MAQASISFGIALLAGTLTVLSPCVLPVLPIIVGRSLQSHRLGPVFLVLGLISGFALVGSLLGVTAPLFSSLISQLRRIAIGLLLLIGIFSIWPHLGYRLAQRLSIHRFFASPKEPTQTGLVKEFILGTQLGLLWTPCAGPVLGSILILAAVQHQVFGAFILLFTYGVGAGLPLLAIAYAGKYGSRSLKRLRPYSQAIQRIGGVAIMLTAIAILLGWDVKIQLWLAPFLPNPML
jgi:cytochrome c-type biogenesis protein